MEESDHGGLIEDHEAGFAKSGLDACAWIA
jgi:hypothetical protein